MENTKVTESRRAKVKESPFRYVPRTVLRLESVVKPDKVVQRRRMDDLVRALNQGERGGIGPFEIDVLDWVNKLRYVTTEMIMDLYEGGYLLSGWRSVKKDKLPDIFNRLEKYQLVNLSRFTSVDENGCVNSSEYSSGRIVSLDRQGSNVLNELGIRASFNPFDIYQNGNTVKGYLATNQWLVYWLKNHPEEVKNNYATARVLFLLTTERNGARIYATVTCSGKTMLAEPLRRCDEFMKDQNQKEVFNKLERLVNILDNPNDIYCEMEAVHFEGRPIITYVCEDEAHIGEAWEMLREETKKYPQQEIWLTSDLRIYNDTLQEEEKFVRCKAGEIL